MAGVRSVRAAAPSSSRLHARVLALKTSAQFCEDADLDSAGFGAHCFKGDVASKYLSKYGESSELLDSAAWTANKSDVVANALLDWCEHEVAPCEGPALTRAALQVQGQRCQRLLPLVPAAGQLRRGPAARAATSRCAGVSRSPRAQASATARPALCTTP